ncbi:hypothetical protein J4E86_010516 [Alternaria arbusti]|uniref:uncharacterized protein n=1 Tax=Alternaria arbusti TaxID=232088 RepID=UPI00221EE9CF|nr:uncharacterized protein J4E86_010516 [Alternaria arbusti]KAI4941483.1 hypothetical protein J4E86_010516 [Alternaria arbusti]
MAPSSTSNEIRIEPGAEVLADVSMNNSHPVSQHDNLGKRKPFVRVESLDRLKWNVLASPSTIEAVDFDESGEVCWRPLLLDPKHPLADEAVTKLPIPRMGVKLVMIEYWKSLGMMDEAPPPLVIDNTDGRTITIEQFVLRVSEYAYSLREMLCEIEDREPSSQESAEIYYYSTGAPKLQEPGNLYVFPLNFKTNESSSVHEIEAQWVRREWLFVENYGG